MDFSPLEKYLQQQVDSGVPGCELVVCRDGEILFHSCAGFSDYEKTKKASSEDRYMLYSCTKPMTATAAMHRRNRWHFGKSTRRKNPRGTNMQILPPML